jgi:hypothetical protein
VNKILLICVLVTNFVLFCQTPEQPSGDGTVVSPYLVANIANLYWITASDAEVPVPSQFSRWAAHYIQTVNIDASATSGWNSGAGWSPIGNFTLKFSGTYNGQNLTISGLYINRPAQDYVGLFGYKTTGSTISNLKLTGINISGKSYVGGLSGYQYNGSVTNCFTSGSVTGTVECTGGLIGTTYYGTLISCGSSAIVSGIKFAGGLLGYSYAGPISGSFATGSVSGTQNTGGLIGYLRSSVTNSYATGNVSGGLDVGGLLGGGYDNYTASSCYSTGDVRGNAEVGGFAAFVAYSATVSDCYSTGNVIRNTGSTDTVIAGFVGMNYNAKVLRCFSTGSVVYEGASNPVNRGFAGYINTGAGYQMTGNFWDIETSGQTSTLGAATGKTTTEMKTQTTFTTAAWNFSTPVWKIVSGVIYPYLAWQPSSNLTFEENPEGTTPSNGVDGEYPIGTDLHLLAYLPPFGSDIMFVNWTDDTEAVLTEEYEFDYTVAANDAVITANYITGSTDFNLTIGNDGTNVILDWSDYLGAVYYRVYSSDNPNIIFELDDTGIFNGSQWIAPSNGYKRFYYVVACN